MKQLTCATLEGIEAREVAVEVTFTRGLPAFSIVGLASSAIQESRDRIKSALIVNGFSFPPVKITVNLSPSEIKKEGTHFDLPIALLIALQNSAIETDDWAVFGELGLDGSVKETNALFALLLSLASNGVLKRALVPYDALESLKTIPNLILYGIKTIEEGIEFFNNQESFKSEGSASFKAEEITVVDKKLYHNNSFALNFSDVKGQENAKRAALIAAAGMHNLIMEGSPGSGKSMIAKRISHILPPMTQEEILHKAKLSAVDGKKPSFNAVRTFRSPHHTSTRASIFGGGSGNKPQIGEVALVHNGVLFFDELPHFPKAILEALREPLEDRHLLISRVNSKIDYPTSFMFIGAMNPCPCGNLLSQNKSCRCSDLEITRYKNRLSEPFLDRIDLHVTMQEIRAEDRASSSSQELYNLVLKALESQIKRGQKSLNGLLNDSEITQYCATDLSADETLKQGGSRFGLSHRSINKTLKVARTIADLQQSDIIRKEHVLEAFSFRRRI